MLAVLKTGGKQYIVKEGDVIDVEKIEGKEGDKIKLGEVLLIADKDKINIGGPFIKGAEVELEIKNQFKDKKVEIVKFKRKKGYKRKKGHRQMKTKIEIKKIKG